MKVTVLFFNNTSDPSHDVAVRKRIHTYRGNYPKYIHCAVVLVDEQNHMALFESTVSGGRFTTDVLEIIKLIHWADRISFATVEDDAAKLNAAIAQHQVALNLRKMSQALQGGAPAPTCTAPANILLGTNAFLCDELHKQMMKMEESASTSTI